MLISRAGSRAGRLPICTTRSAVLRWWPATSRCWWWTTNGPQIASRSMPGKTCWIRPGRAAWPFAGTARPSARPPSCISGSALGWMPCRDSAPPSVATAIRLASPRRWEAAMRTFRRRPRCRFFSRGFCRDAPDFASCGLARGPLPVLSPSLCGTKPPSG